MKYLVAVSGGVDSIVLLHLLVRVDRLHSKLVVAHVNHGIRGSDSDLDERFVKGLAKHYNLPFVSTQLNLSSSASEDEARKGRYDFLNRQAAEYQAKLVLAHHQDDLIGSIAINIVRGTGWRGLGVMSRSNVVRPLLSYRKAQLESYAVRHRLEWVEDKSNHSMQYLRNRLRAGVINLSDDRRRPLINLQVRQMILKKQIVRESNRILEHNWQNKYFFTHIDSKTAIELIRQKLIMMKPEGITNDHAASILHHIKTARAGSMHTINKDFTLNITARSFVVSLPSQ